MLDVVEVATPHEVQAAEAGFRWLGLEAAAAAVAAVRQEIQAGVLEDLSAAEELERRADVEYGRVVPNDQALFDAFRRRFVEAPQSFAPA